MNRERERKIPESGLARSKSRLKEALPNLRQRQTGRQLGQAVGSPKLPLRATRTSSPSPLSLISLPFSISSIEEEEIRVRVWIMLTMRDKDRRFFVRRRRNEGFFRVYEKKQKKVTKFFVFGGGSELNWAGLCQTRLPIQCLSPLNYFSST